jgi:IS5 family transposase
MLAQKEPGKTQRSSRLTGGCPTGKAQVADNPDGVVLDYQVEVGNLLDAPLLAPAVERIAARAGRVPRAVTTDRGYGEATVDQQLHALGVARVGDSPQGPAGTCPPRHRAHAGVPGAGEMAHRL